MRKYTRYQTEIKLNATDQILSKCKQPVAVEGYDIQYASHMYHLLRLQCEVTRYVCRENAVTYFARYCL